MAYTVLNARVKQKIETEAGWIAEEDTFGVILEGEQAFVKDDAGTLVNFKIGDGTKKFSELPYFIVYYTGVTNQKILTYLGQTDNITISGQFRDKTLLMDLIFINNSGVELDLAVGTTDGGSEILACSVPVGAVTIGRHYEFTDAETVYLTGLTGATFDLFILYYQLDEAPAVPPGSTGSFRFPKGYKGMFEPLYAGHENEVWDFATGLGKPGTGYDNCALSGTNFTQDMGGFYPVGWKIGDGLHPATTFGNTAVTLAEANIPKIQLKMFTQAGPAGNLSPGGENSAVAWSSAHGSGNQDYDMKKGMDINPSVGITSAFGSDTPTPLDIRPKSKATLYFVAITD